MNILVTGGAGYIGSILVPELLAQGHSVTVIDNFRYGQTSLLGCCANSHFTVVNGDVREKTVVKDGLKNVDAIFLLAALVGAPACDRDPITARTVNYEAVKMLLELRSKNQVIIFPTTNSGYGIGQKGIYCTEETPLNPISLYGRLKVEAEKAVLDSGNAITLRLATVFGISPRMRLDLLVNDFVYRAVTDLFIVLFEADFPRNYIHIRDVAGAFMHFLERFDEMKDEPYNVGDSEANMSKLQLCEVIQQILPDFHYFVSDIGKDPDQRNYLVSNEKIERTGYRPEFPIEAGIRELVKGYCIVRQRQYNNRI